MPHRSEPVHGEQPLQRRLRPWSAAGLIVLASLVLNAAALAHPVDAAAALRLDWFPVAAPNAITAGPDGNLWFTTGELDGPFGIGRITPQGKVTRYPLNLPYVDSIAQGPIERSGSPLGSLVRGKGEWHGSAPRGRW
jgi:hypothetical protein